ncbi:hypothetical protein ACFFGT_02770 [Mucilaginibacter angelicae]|uniref:YubB ferredoxin-like domain-containing protein n=1 Tax=Mucilaginibacter angelicae TaxID=869718 RepID=A0ABV6L158_9SPHI
MANWCSNTVEFIGEHSQFEELGRLFKAMATKEKKERRGQLPPFAEVDSGYLFEIRWEGGVLYYETKWSPNTEVIVAIADHFKIGFRYNYSEPGNCVFGEAAYRDGTLTDVALDWDDIAAYDFDEDTDTYRFENQNYDSSEEILEKLLERKKAIRKLQGLNNG